MFKILRYFQNLPFFVVFLSFFCILSIYFIFVFLSLYLYFFIIYFQIMYFFLKFSGFFIIFDYTIHCKMMTGI